MPVPSMLIREAAPNCLVSNVTVVELTPLTARCSVPTCVIVRVALGRVVVRVELTAASR